MLESDLWKYLKGRLPGLHERVENGVMVGPPDVDCIYKGLSYKIELKINRNKYKPLNAIEILAPIQLVWHKKYLKERGLVYTVIKQPQGKISVYKLISKEDYLEIINEQYPFGYSGMWKSFFKEIEECRKKFM